MLSLDSVNDQFQNVAITSKHKPASHFVLPSDDVINNDNCFNFNMISVLTVLSHLTSLDVTKSTGPDGLSARFLKEISNEIVEPLTRLYNESLCTGFIPLD